MTVQTRLYLISSRTKRLHMALLSSILFPRTRTFWSAKTSTWGFFKWWHFLQRLESQWSRFSLRFTSHSSVRLELMCKLLKLNIGRDYPVGQGIKREGTQRKRFIWMMWTSARALDKKKLVVLYVNFPSNIDSKCFWMIFIMYSFFHLFSHNLLNANSELKK